MRILFLALLLTIPAFAKVTSARIDTSSTNITIHFNGTNGLVPLASMQVIKSAMIDNRSASEIVVNCSTTSGTVPSDSSQYNVYIAANEAWVFPDDSLFASACYIRSFSGTISSGIIVISAVGY